MYKDTFQFNVSTDGTSTEKHPISFIFLTEETN